MTDLKVVIFTQGVSPIVEPILGKYRVLGIVESAPRGSVETVGQTRLTEFCQRRKVPYFWLSKATHEALVPFLLGLGTLDIGVVYSMSQLLPQAVLDLFPRGVLNCHPSKLPAYRGPNPYFWAFYDGCAETALTVHYLDAGEDTGDVVLQRNIPIEYDVAGYERSGLEENVKGLLGPTILDALELVHEGKTQRCAQSETSPTARARNVTPENVREILKGLNLPLEMAGCFFANTLGMLPLRQFGMRRLSGDWKVKRVVPCKMSHECDVDRIQLTRYGFAIARPDGWIVLTPRINTLRFMLKLIRDWMRHLKFLVKKERFDFYRLTELADGNDGPIDVREVDRDNLDDVMSYRDKATRDLFSSYLSSGQRGYYAYRDGKVVGHAWVLPEHQCKRRLFGWLPVPKDCSFIYYCKARPQILKSFIGSIGRKSKVDGTLPLGISVPSSDIELSLAVSENGFKHTSKVWKIEFLRCTFVFKGRT